MTDNKNLTYNYEIEISGNGGFQIVEEISKATYEYFCEDDELLESHIFDEEEVPDELSIGYWDRLCENFDLSSTEGYYELGECSISIDSVDSVDSVDESYSFFLDEKELKDLGIKLIREKQTTIDELVKPGEIKYFFLGIEEHEGTWNYQLTTKKPFDPRKLEITVCKVESRNFVTFIDYGDNEGPELSDASNDYDRTLEVIKVDKTQVAGKLKKDYQEIRYFEFKDAHSSKFWEVSVASSTVTARYGKIGTNGQTSVKELDSPEQAQEHATKQAAGKPKRNQWRMDNGYTSLQHHFQHLIYTPSRHHRQT